MVMVRAHIFYHSDHLGSASWITNHNGDAVQHLQYLPYGEPFVDQHPAGYQERYTFTDAKDNPTPDNILYVNAAQLDLGFLTVDNSGLRLGDDYTYINLYDYVNSKSPRSVSTTYALGNTAIKLLDNTGTIAFKGDVYDWDYHDGSPMRNTLIFFERLRTGLNDNHGFKVSIYGTAKINQKWPF